MDDILATPANHNAEPILGTDPARGDTVWNAVCPTCGILSDHVDYDSAADHADDHTTGDDANGLEAA